MRRVNIHLDDDLDDELMRESRRTGESRASLLRRAAREFLARRADAGSDRWDDFTGAVVGEVPQHGHDDDVIYR